ncbi:MAG: restriction endonuclease subunit S, partial [Oscillospiraceae bacterium]|nr:restriction endonuclease subunit S [Oscillospiraceae bacterium]
PQLETAAKTDAHDDRKLVKKGDFAINSRSDRRGSCGISDYDGSVSLINTVLTPRGEMHPVYYNWLFHSSSFADEFYRWGHGIVDDLWTTRWQEMRNITIPVPEYAVQQKIAAHLDRKCTQIDALISNAQQQIEKLKALRDAVLREVLSEGANITDICREQYTTTKMGSIGTYKKGPFGSSLKKSMFVPKGEKTFKVYEQKNAIYKNATLGYYYISEEKFNELKSFEICPGDIIISCAGTIGECYEIPVDAEKGVINQALMYVRLNKDMDTLFFTYLFEFVIKSISLTDSNGSAMKNIPPFDKIKPFIISIPSTKEKQHKLAEYIQKKIKTITDLAEIKQKKIEKLQQYKKSLIYEYVTGKKEV